MHIVIITGPFLPPPPGPAGAVERVWHGLAVEFVKRGHRVTFIGRSPPGQSKEVTADGIEMIRVPGPNRPKNIFIAIFRDYWYSRRASKVVPPDADLVVTNGFWLPVTIRKQAGRPLVMPNVQRIPKGQLRLYDQADRLLVVSEAVRKLVATQRPGLLDRTRVIPNPIDTDHFHPGDQPKRESPAPVVLFVGRLHPEKGIGVLLAAARKLIGEGSRFALRIVGPWTLAEGGGGPEYLAVLKREAEGLPVEFLEPVYGRAELATIYREADLFCYPSLADAGETFGVAPLEAMACGTATIVSNLACFRDFLQPGINGLVFDHHDPDPAGKLAECLRELINDPATRRRIGDEGAKTATNYGLPRVAGLYLDEFEKAIG